MSKWIVPEFQRSFDKQPWEEVDISVDFSDKVPAYFGQITSAVFSATKWPIADPSAKSDGGDVLDSTTGIIDAPYLTHVKVRVRGGDPDYDYAVTCRAQTSDGLKLERDFIIRIRE